MIQRDKIIAAFDSKAELFNSFDREFHDNSALYDLKLLQFTSSEYENIRTRLSEHDSPGALPSEEFNRANRMVIRFGEEWSSHEAARRWASQTLINRVTFAADGSQIMPSKDLSIPVAAVQVAWFENPHTPDGRYTKDSRFEILTPLDLLIGHTSERQLSEQMVNLRRFQLEIDVLCEYMNRYSLDNDPIELPPVVFLDSSIVISFAERWHEDQRRLFIEPVVRLLDTSRATGIPVVGYVDTTYACDLTVMFKHYFDLDIKRSPVHDAYLFRHLSWGDRTIFFNCARAGLLDEFGEHRRGVGFVYLKTNQGLPARLDIPVWVYERGLLDYVIDMVRAEVVVGTGYPYALSAADAAAFISAQDREAFYGIFQQFIERQDIDLHISQKNLSKIHRR
jgi:hypothetical protein